MKTSTNPGAESADSGRFADHWLAELAGLLVLALLAAAALADSWRKWPDPITDTGAQWFAFWRLSHGATLFHDVPWNYGPLSATFNAALFRWFGPGMMVLVASNLAVCGLFAALAYAAFRKAWGRWGAFAALAVFICVFSFPRLNGVNNYNYATPYANESTHGMLLLLVTVLVTVWWCRGPSRWLALCLGLCGGLAAVLKPEFMLAGGVLGIVACIVRGCQRQRVGAVEYLAILAGLALPTLVFAAAYVFRETSGQALADASHAWWGLLAHRHETLLPQQGLYMGLNQPWTYALKELKAALAALGVCAGLWATGWMASRPWIPIVRLMLIIAAGALVYEFLPDFSAPGGWANGWLNVGLCFPGMMLVIFLVQLARAAAQWQSIGRVEEPTMAALTLTLAAGAMLARMPLHARIFQLGFYQGALAGMVLAAFLVAELPRWTGGAGGRRIARLAALATVTAGCVMIATMSHIAHAGQTVSVGAGRDQFYGDAPEIDATASLVEWTVEYLQTVPPRATICVLPEGDMINYLSRRTSPVHTSIPELQMLAQMRRTPPDYVVFISRDLSEAGVTSYGHPGENGYLLLQWLRGNYAVATGRGGDPFDSKSAKGVLILRRDPSVTSAPVTTPAAQSTNTVPVK